MLAAKCHLFLSCYILISALSISASAIGGDKLQLSGFATLGAVTSDSENYGYRKNLGSDEGVYADDIDFKQHSLLGLQVDWSIYPSFDFVYQGVLRDLPEPSFDRYTTLAFLRYDLNSNWSFRAGRTAADLFLVTEYRDVDFSYIWATAPSEIYSIIPYRSLDGFDVTYTKRAFGGVFKTKLFTGSSETEIASSTVVEEVKVDDAIGLSLSYDRFNWIVYVKHSQVKIASETQSNQFLMNSVSQVPDFLWPNSPAYAQSLSVENENVSYSSISGQYQWSQWLASAEMSQINSDSKVIPQITSGYASLSYQFNEHQFYGVYAMTTSDNYVFSEQGVNEAALGELIQGIKGAANFYASNQDTISLGWRWDFTHSMATSLQWNYTNVDKGGSTLWLKKNIIEEKAETINTLFFTLSMVF